MGSGERARWPGKKGDPEGVLVTTRNYEIRVTGSIGPAAREAFSGMGVDVEPLSTVLFGPLDKDGLQRTLDRVRAQIPLGRLGRPEEVARVVCFLAADQSAYITGQIWAVNGGLDM